MIMPQVVAQPNKRRHSSKVTRVASPVSSPAMRYESKLALIEIKP
jgi:hypothetical protein